MCGIIKVFMKYKKLFGFLCLGFLVFIYFTSEHGVLYTHQETLRVNVHNKTNHDVKHESNLHLEQVSEMLLDQQSKTKLEEMDPEELSRRNKPNKDKEQSSQQILHQNITTQSTDIHQRYTFKLRTESNTTLYTNKGLEDTGLYEECLTRNYGDFKTWPKASIILPFIDNELLVDVLHTIHSIFQRTPADLLEEVILIADNVTKAEFQETFDNYCGAVFGEKVRIIRSDVTLGLIKGRVLGARAAKGDIIVMLDAHMEVQDTWLQALVWEIRQNRKTLALPMLDHMKPKAKGWEYINGSNIALCMYGWDLKFRYNYPRPELVFAHLANNTAPFPTPAAIGHWAMEKKFFQQIGELDEGMELWGAENLELPVRVWLFGGHVVQVPCCHIAHLERPQQRNYRKGWEKYILRNFRRLVEVWFDEYKELVYRNLPELLTVSAGDISKRLQLKKKAIHNFKWYLEHVYPEMGIYNRGTLCYDWIQNLDTKHCLHQVDNQEKLTLGKCQDKSPKDIFLTTDGYLRSDIFYWQVNEQKIGSVISRLPAITYYGEWLSKWIHWKGGPLMLYDELENVSKNLCLEPEISGGQNVSIVLKPCDPYNLNQRWKCKTYSQDYLDLISKERHHKTEYAKILLKIKNQWPESE